MAEPVLFEPEVEHLLREIAADPRSCLLRVARPAVVRSLYHREREVSANATGLTLAERELLRVFRCEAAKLLREACVYRLATHPEGQTWLLRQLTPRRVLRIPNHADWVIRATQTVADSRPHHDELVGVDLLVRCVSPSASEEVSVGQLAAASIRLEPTEQAWIYPAIEQVNERQSQLALVTLSKVLATSPSAWHSTFAWTQVGRAEFDLGHYPQAVSAYRRAAEIDASRIPALLGWLASACLARDAEQFSIAANHVDALLPTLHEGTDQIAEALSDASSRFQSKDKADFAAVVAKHSDRLGTNSRRIADVLV